MIDAQLNILLSSDDNYAQHLGATIYSLLSQNSDAESICIYVVDNGIEYSNKANLESIVEKYSNASIAWISFEKWKSQLKLNMTWNISLSSYARLFVSEMLPETIDRVLYLDCDMIICESLQNLWSTDLHGMVLGAIQDSISDGTKSSVGLLPNERYFNAGMLLIDLKKWREQHIGDKCLQFISDKNGAVVHHDQGVLNGVFRNQWECLPLKYNLMTIHYIYNCKQVMNYYGEHAVFYSEDEIEGAKRKPVILHYTPSFTTRPWVKNCKHPMKKMYWDAVANTPWSDVKAEKSKERWYVRLINWRYRTFKR